MQQTTRRSGNGLSARPASPQPAASTRFTAASREMHYCRSCKLLPSLAIRAAMKGQEPSRINHAVRQGQMYADFLVLLVNRTNWAILDDSQVRWLKIALFYERLRNAALSNDEAQAVNEWAVILRG